METQLSSRPVRVVTWKPYVLFWSIKADINAKDIVRKQMMMTTLIIVFTIMMMMRRRRRIEMIVDNDDRRSMYWR